MRTRVTKIARTAVLSLGLAAASAGVASAQQGGAGGTAGGSGAGTTGRTSGGTTGTTDTRRDDRGFDWGWLGLIGLAGLIPLFTRRNGHAESRNAGSTRGSMAH